MASQLKGNRRLLIHGAILLILLVYMLSADCLFDHLIVLNGESTPQDIEVSHETVDIRYYVDAVSKQEIAWKDVVSIIGWAFVEGKDGSDSTKHIALRSDRKTYVFNTYIMLRPDLTEHFKDLGLDLDASGFQSSIPVIKLDDGIYNVGIVVTHDNTTSLVWTDNVLEKRNGKVLIQCAEQEDPSSLHRSTIS